VVVVVVVIVVLVSVADVLVNVVAVAVVVVVADVVVDVPVFVVAVVVVDVAVVVVVDVKPRPMSCGRQLSPKITTADGASPSACEASMKSKSLRSSLLTSLLPTKVKSVPLA